VHFKVIKELSWYQATIFSLISGLTSFFVFLFMEIIFGDTLKSILDVGYQSERYFNLNLILFIGLFFVFFASFIINYFTLRKYETQPKLISNIFILGFTCVILFFVSWLSIVSVYSDIYQQLTIGEQIKLSPYFWCIFSIYILPNPVYFWILGMLLYHFILIIFIKFFFVKKTTERNSFLNYKRGLRKWKTK